MQLIDAFVAIETQLEVRSKPLTYLLSKYGFDVDAMIAHKIAVTEEEIEDQQAILIAESPSPVRDVDQSKIDIPANSL